jgi:hypothetical protein
VTGGVVITGDGCAATRVDVSAAAASVPVAADAGAPTGACDVTVPDGAPVKDGVASGTVAAPVGGTPSAEVNGAALRSPASSGVIVAAWTTGDVGVAMTGAGTAEAGDAALR